MFHTLSQCTYSTVHFIDDSFVENGKQIAVEVDGAELSRCLDQATSDATTADVVQGGSSYPDGRWASNKNYSAKGNIHSRHTLSSDCCFYSGSEESYVSRIGKSPLMASGSWSVKNQRNRMELDCETWRAVSQLTVRPRPPDDWSRLTTHLREPPKFSGGEVTKRLLHGTPQHEETARVLQQQEDDEHLRTYTPRQRKLYASLEPADTLTEETLQDAPTVRDQLLSGLSESERRYTVKQMFKDFVVELTRGAYFTQLAAGNTYITLHCQLTEDLDALTVDPNTGERIEFPTLEILKVYMVEREAPRSSEIDNTTQYSCNSGAERSIAADKRCSFNSNTHPSQTTGSFKVPPLDFRQLLRHMDYVVVVQFRIRRLAFVFRDEIEANRFKLCFDLLIRYLKHCGRLRDKRFCYLKERFAAPQEWFPLFAPRKLRGKSESAHSSFTESCFLQQSPSLCCAPKQDLYHCDVTPERSIEYTQGHTVPNAGLERSTATATPPHLLRQFHQQLNTMAHLYHDSPWDTSIEYSNTSTIPSPSVDRMEFSTREDPSPRDYLSSQRSRNSCPPSRNTFNETHSVSQQKQNVLPTQNPIGTRKVSTKADYDISDSGISSSHLDFMFGHVDDRTSRISVVASSLLSLPSFNTSSVVSSSRTSASQPSERRDTFSVPSQRHSDAHETALHRGGLTCDGCSRLPYQIESNMDVAKQAVHFPKAAEMNHHEDVNYFDTVSPSVIIPIMRPIRHATCDIKLPSSSSSALTTRSLSDCNVCCDGKPASNRSCTPSPEPASTICTVDGKSDRESSIVFEEVAAFVMEDVLSQSPCDCVLHYSV